MSWSERNETEAKAKPRLNMYRGLMMNVARFVMAHDWTRASIGGMKICALGKFFGCCENRVQI